MNGGWGAGLGFMKNSLLRERGGVHKWKWVVKVWKICNRFSPPPSYNHLTEITESRGCRQNLSGQLRGF